MSADNIFGPLVDRDLVETTLIAFLQLWMDTYLAEIERIKVIDVRSLPRPRSYVQANRFQRWTEEQLPALIVVSPGLSEPPKKDGSGLYRAKWNIGIGMTVGAGEEEANRALIGYYMAAIRMLMVHKPSIGGFGLGIEWTDERYNDTPEDFRRSTASGQLLFKLEVNAVVQAYQGPATADPPPVDPIPDPGNWPEVVDVSAGATITKEPIA